MYYLTENKVPIIGSYDFATAFVLGSLQVTKVHDPRFVVALAVSGTQSLPDLGILGQKDRKNGILDFYPARVMKRLQLAEALEAEPYYKQHIRQAWIVLSFLQKGMTDAFVQSSYVVYGKHPSDVWPAVVADRKARLGNEYHIWYDSADNLRPDVPHFSPTTAHRADRADSANWDGSVGPVPTDKERIV